MNPHRKFPLLAAWGLILTLGLAKVAWGQAPATQSPPTSGTKQPTSYEGLKRVLMQRYGGTDPVATLADRPSGPSGMNLKRCISISSLASSPHNQHL